MYINGNLDNIISILEEYKSNNLFNNTDIYHIDISVLKNNSKQIAISKNTLTPVEDFYELNNTNTDDAIISPITDSFFKHIKIINNICL